MHQSMVYCFCIGVVAALAKTAVSIVTDSCCVRLQIVHHECRPIPARYSVTLLHSLIALCALLLSVHLVSTFCMTASFFNS
jgi:hypothetical protein